MRRGVVYGYNWPLKGSMLISTFTNTGKKPDTAVNHHEGLRVAVKLRPEGGIAGKGFRKETPAPQEGGKRGPKGQGLSQQGGITGLRTLLERPGNIKRERAMVLFGKNVPDTNGGADSVLEGGVGIE